MSDDNDGIEIECPTCGALCTTDPETGDHEPVYRDDDDDGKLRAELAHLRENLTKAEASVAEHKAAVRALRVENANLTKILRTIINNAAEVATAALSESSATSEGDGDGR